MSAIDPELKGCVDDTATLSASAKGSKQQTAAANDPQSAILSAKPLPSAGSWDTPDPFLFCVYHKDMYPPGDEKMQAPKRGNGNDFNPTAPYRMYHGDRIPGFPQHPHRGFETVTCTIEGLVDHTDSLGNGGRYGQGDLQWMTAGKGIVHGEMFPLLKPDANNNNRFFQLWLNLPAADKMVDPDFKMHWAPEIPKVLSGDQKTEITVWAGNYGKKQALAPPTNSWAARPSSDVAIWRIRMQPGSTVALPPAAGGAGVNRSLYFYEGDRVRVAERSIKQHSQLTVRADAEVSLVAEGSQEVEILMLQGKPIGEPVSQSGPFVMNTAKEIRQAYMDYQNTRFGGWPWPEDAMVFPREKGRFAKLRGVESYPPESRT